MLWDLVTSKFQHIKRGAVWAQWHQNSYRSIGSIKGISTATALR